MHSLICLGVGASSRGRMPMGRVRKGTPVGFVSNLSKPLKSRDLDGLIELVGYEDAVLTFLRTDDGMARRLRISFSLSLISALLFFVASCATEPLVENPFSQSVGAPPLIGFYYKVEASDTLSGISKRFNVPADKIREANKLSDGGLIESGQLLYVPLQKRSALLNGGTTTGYDKKSFSTSVVQSDHFIWPLNGKVITRFGVKKDQITSKGIDIASGVDHSVRAANDGIVSFAESELSGLGKMVVIDHGNGFQTVYAHNEKNLVKVGETVKRSDIIALVGSTGRAAEPFLHFEIRKNHRPVDPLEYLR